VDASGVILEDAAVMKRHIANEATNGGIGQLLRDLAIGAASHTADCIVLGIAGDRAQPRLVLGLRHADRPLVSGAPIAVAEVAPTTLERYSWFQAAGALPPVAAGLHSRELLARATRRTC
jgi:hypothetical protein